MEEKEIVIDGKKRKIVTKLPKEDYEDNSAMLFLEDTIELDDVIKEINEDGKE